MPDEVILPLSARNRKAWLYFATIGPAAILTALLGPWILDGMGFEDLRIVMEYGFGWWYIGLVAFAPLFFVNIALTNLLDRLVFTGTTLERRGIPNPAIFRGPVACADITRVQAGGFGILLVETRSGKVFRLFPKAYEGGVEAVLSRLRERVPVDRFENQLEEGLARRTRRDVLTPWISIAAVWLIAAGGLTDLAIDQLRKNRAWTLEIDARSMDQTIEDFALGPNGMLWLLVRNRRRDVLDSGSYGLRGVGADGEQAWQIPATDDLFPAGVPDSVLPFPIGLSLAPEGEPRLNFGLDVLALRFGEETWEWVLPETSMPFADLAQWTGHSYWTRLQTEGMIRASDLLSGDVLELELAGEGLSFLLEYKVRPAGGFLAQIATRDRRYFLALVPGPEQEMIWEEVDVTPFRGKGYWNLVDYYMDADSKLYVLVQDEGYCSSGHPASSLGLLNARGGAWQWWTLTQPGECRNVLGEGQLVVDAHGRIWVSTLRDLTVLPSDSLNRGTSAGAIHYSEDNSGYMAGRKLELGPDGRIWSLDLLGDGLGWIDSNAEELGKPLPEWIASLRRELWWKIGPGLVGLALFMGSAFWNRSVASRRRRREEEDSRRGRRWKWPRRGTRGMLDMD